MTRDERLIDLTQRAIRAKSYSGQEKEAIEVFKEAMIKNGFDEVFVDKYGSLIGCIKGNEKGKRILLDGHIDTVDVIDEESWTYPPFKAEIHNNRIYGRGASDMKGSDAAMIEAVTRFKEDTKGKFKGEVYVSLTVHEECFEGISAMEVAKRVKPDFVIIGEATSNTIKIGQRGRAEVVVETEGKSCHSSNPEKGENAVYNMCTLIEEIRKIKPNTHPILGKGILELTDIISYPYPGASVVPSSCIATFDRRTLVGEDEKIILSQIEEAIARAKKKIPSLKAKTYLRQGSHGCYTGETISAKRLFPAWVIEKDNEFVKKAIAGLKKANIDVKISHFSFCTNGSGFMGELGIPCIGYGPSEESLAHVRDEYIDLDELKLGCAGVFSIISEILSQI